MASYWFSLFCNEWHCLFTDQAYDNIKKRSKKAAASDRAEHFKTGGGTYAPTMDAVDEKIVSLLGHRATPLPNPYDSAAHYYSQSKLMHSSSSDCCASITFYCSGFMLLEELLVKAWTSFILSCGPITVQSLTPLTWDLENHTAAEASAASNKTD